MYTADPTEVNIFIYQNTPIDDIIIVVMVLKLSTCFVLVYIPTYQFYTFFEHNNITNANNVFVMS